MKTENVRGAILLWGKIYYITFALGEKLTMGENCYTTPAPMSHSGIRTPDAKIIRSLCPML
jgi:hypothetical protein